MSSYPAPDGSLVIEPAPTHEEIAKRVGTTREQVTRVMRDFAKRGVIEHRDSTGNTRRLPPGEFQLMSAGSGITHSEYNASQGEPLEFLQIWVIPDRRGVTPGYQQKRFADASGLTLVASPDARDGSLRMHQDACLYRAQLDHGAGARLALAAGRCAYVHVVSGELDANGERLEAGDGAALTGTTALALEGASACEALVFDLP